MSRVKVRLVASGRDTSCSVLSGPVNARFYVLIRDLLPRHPLPKQAEAKWAAFFDLCGIPWLYEPVDQDHYIPDFIIQGKVLAEVKGVNTIKELTALEQRLCDRNGKVRGCSLAQYGMSASGPQFYCRTMPNPCGAACNRVQWKGERHREYAEPDIKVAFEQFSTPHRKAQHRAFIVPELDVGDYRARTLPRKYPGSPDESIALPDMF